MSILYEKILIENNDVSAVFVGNPIQLKNINKPLRIEFTHPAASMYDIYFVSQGQILNSEPFYSGGKIEYTKNLFSYREAYPVMISKNPVSIETAYNISVAPQNTNIFFDKCVFNILCKFRGSINISSTYNLLQDYLNGYVRAEYINDITDAVTLALKNSCKKTLTEIVSSAMVFKAFNELSALDTHTIENSIKQNLLMHYSWASFNIADVQITVTNISEIVENMNKFVAQLQKALIDSFGSQKLPPEVYNTVTSWMALHPEENPVKFISDLRTTINRSSMSNFIDVARQLGYNNPNSTGITADMLMGDNYHY